MVKTGDVIIKGGQRYEVIIADSRIFVLCPKVGSTVDYMDASVFSNDCRILTLEKMGMQKSV